MYSQPLGAKMLLTVSTPHPKNVNLQSVNDIWYCIMDVSTAVQQHQHIMQVLASIMGKNASHDISTTF